MDLVIDVYNLNKSFGGKRVVKDVSIQVRRGEIFGFLGPNGSGKTTSIRMMCGLLTPDSGEGTCLGYDILRQSASIKRRVGYMTQRFSYWEDLSIWENLDFVSRVYGVPDRRRAIAETIKSLGLMERKDQLAGTLSGGWKQRLTLAACLLHQPDLLLLDEPTAGVDPVSRRDFWDELHQLAATGISVLVSTHYMDEAERCHKLAYIASGVLLEHGTAADIIARQHLVTYKVCGEKLDGLGARLRHSPGVDQVMVFGNAMHVTGKDARVLEQTMQEEVSADFDWTQIDSSLEDVFIYLMARAQKKAGADSGLPPEKKRP